MAFPGSSHTLHNGTEKHQSDHQEVHLARVQSARVKPSATKRDLSCMICHNDVPRNYTCM